MTSPTFSIIVSTNFNEDLRYFEKIINGKGNNAVIMKKKEYYVISDEVTKVTKVTSITTKDTYSTLSEALFVSLSGEYDDIFICGGIKIYEQVMTPFLKWCGKIYLNKSNKLIKIPSNFDFSTTHPKEKNVDNYMIYYKNQEQQYLDLLKEILRKGVEKSDRTGVGTLSLFGKTMTFDISDKIPILTTKKVFYNTVIKELLFFISGETNTKFLEEQKVNIWKGNTSLKFLRDRGLDYKEGDYGASYGFQWRHYGAKYTGCNLVNPKNSNNSNNLNNPEPIKNSKKLSKNLNNPKTSDKYKGKGVDQLKELIINLKKNPSSRRHIITSWNVAQLKQMALPPCHAFVQFNVRNGFLDCSLYQRSGDMFLGVPFNIASYCIFTYIIAHLVDLKPGKFVHCLGDAHIYKNHIKQVKLQLTRTPKPFPRLRINRKVKDIDDFKFEDFAVEDYKCWPYIRAKMAI